MNNNLSFNESKIDEEEIKEQEEVDNEEEKGENSFKEQPTIPSNNDEFRSKMIKMFGIVIIALIVVLIVGFLISLFTKKNYTYAELEDVMKNASIKYFKDNKSKLPKDESEIVEIDSNILVNNKYMKSLDKYLKDDSCTGKVSVEKIDNKSYSYTPKITCKDYTTTKLYAEITKKDKIVTEGFGLYFMNNEYVYRGSNVNNYVKFNDSKRLWRIIKANSNGEIVLISARKTNELYSWDRRYNNQTDDNSGVGIYKNSNIYDSLEDIYNNKYVNDDSVGEVEFLTNEDKKKLVEFNSCVGSRSKAESTKDGTKECAITEKVKISLISAYDFLNASLDPNCNSTEKPDCQNYNYLARSYTYWSSTPSEKISGMVYKVNSSGYLEKGIASTESYIRPVIHLSENTMLVKGKGTKSNPYVIR